MREATIKAEPRKEKGTQACRRLRQRGLVPGVVYGHGEPTVDIVMDDHDLRQVLHTGAHMFDLKVKGAADEKVLVKEVQYDSLGDAVIHLDLQRVSLTDTVEVTVPIVLVGTAIGAVHKGVVDQPLKELHIACTPDRIPDDVRLTVTDLDIDMMLLVKDIPLPEDVVATNAPDQVVVTVHPPVTEEEAEAKEEAAEVEGVLEPEVIGGAPKTEEEESEEEESGKKQRTGR
ncbi:MAG TPA: 50S ribosomal protein L25 [Planctomycetota bacterium]|nr:50S ribosomal protein L25 [Planctomycetota bacterium]